MRQCSPPTTVQMSHVRCHVTPMYKIIEALSQRPAGILLTIFRSINTKVYAQFTHVSRHPGALESFTKMKDLTKLTIEMRSQKLHRITSFGLGIR